MSFFDKQFDQKLAIEVITDLGMEPVCRNGVLEGIQYLGNIEDVHNWNTVKGRSPHESAVRWGQEKRNRLIWKALDQLKRLEPVSERLPFCLNSLRPTGYGLSWYPEKTEKLLNETIEDLSRAVGATESVALAMITNAIDHFNDLLPALGVLGAKAAFSIEGQVVRVWIQRFFEEQELFMNYHAFYEVLNNLSQEFEISTKNTVIKLGFSEDFTVYYAGEQQSFSLYLPIPFEPIGFEQVLRNQIETAINKIESET